MSAKHRDGFPQVSALLDWCDCNYSCEEHPPHPIQWSTTNRWKSPLSLLLLQLLPPRWLLSLRLKSLSPPRRNPTQSVELRQRHSRRSLRWVTQSRGFAALVRRKCVRNILGKLWYDFTMLSRRSARNDVFWMRFVDIIWISGVRVLKSWCPEIQGIEWGLNACFPSHMLVLKRVLLSQVFRRYTWPLLWLYVVSNSCLFPTLNMLTFMAGAAGPIQSKDR